MPKAIVISIDQLGARYLSPYGNTWNPTPGFDNLAATGLTAECCLSSSTNLALTMRSLWTGQHAMDTGNHGSLMQRLENQSQSSLLIQEGDTLSAFPQCEDFTEVLALPATVASEMAESLEHTATAHFISLVMKELERGVNHDLTWIHHSGLGIVWDAPLEYRDRFFGEEDPEIEEIIEPPRGLLADENDPDEIMQAVHAYAAQVSVLDTCLALLLDQIQTLTTTQPDPTLLIVISPRSLPLGHHGGIGHDYSRPATDQLHVPLLITELGPGASSISPSRLQDLLQPEAVYATLLDWLTGDQEVREEREEREEIDAVRQPSLLNYLRFPGRHQTPLSQQLTISRFANEAIGIHSPAWFSISEPEGGFKLYVKPDDRWEVNEIASRRKDIVSEFESFFSRADHLHGEQVNLPESLHKQG